MAKITVMLHEEAVAAAKTPAEQRAIIKELKLKLRGIIADTKICVSRNKIANDIARLKKTKTAANVAKIAKLREQDKQLAAKRQFPRISGLASLQAANKKTLAAVNAAEAKLDDLKGTTVKVNMNKLSSEMKRAVRAPSKAAGKAKPKAPAEVEHTAAQVKNIGKAVGGAIDVGQMSAAELKGVAYKRKKGHIIIDSDQFNIKGGVSEAMAKKHGTSLDEIESYLSKHAKKHVEPKRRKSPPIYD